MLDVLNDLVEELDRLEAILSALPRSAWGAASAAPGWTVTDVVLHLAQTEEAVTASADGRDFEFEAGTGDRTLDEVMDRLVRAEPAAPDAVFARWRAARRSSLAALRDADPHRPLRWAAAALRPQTLATTRLAEHWAHGLDITGPLGIPFPDTDRLRHVAWLAHATLPYAFSLTGLTPRDVFCELVGVSGQTWRFGPPDAESRITGPAGAFCRVGAQRLAPGASGLHTDGPHAAAALQVLRTYAA
ncbi:maleylpyruvate isomerase family mycothiol-dependent enzyme [Krasilnikovia sp. MM14-A1259]|uniref:maleylpyruvate isomerase family mycothiol-dependent enzyme n=1 Tax=Krasilnikovia sp. MM14-A1259 TaxID=3373539 RepID=UPI00380F1D67